MLRDLARYAEQEGLVTEPGFAVKEVRWSIPCDSAGRPTSTLIDLATAAQRRGKRFRRAPHLSQPEIKRGGAGTRHFLADALEVVIRLGAEDDPKVAAKNAYFVGLLARAAAAMPELAPVARHLADPEVQSALREAAHARRARPTDVATIALRGPAGESFYPLDREDWHAWWRTFRRALQPLRKEKGPDGGSAGAMRCFMTGELVTPAKTQPKVRGLAAVGGIASGDSLASFKQDAFRSYGLSQAENAAVSEEAGARYKAALERLIRRGKRLQHTVVAAWYDAAEPPEVDPLPLFEGLEEDEQRSKMAAARKLLAAWRRGEPEARAVGATRYHAYSLSGASGRVMVRDLLDGPFSELLEGLEAWFDDLAIVRRDDASRLARPPKLFAVLAATARELKEIPPSLETALWRAALRRSVPFPRDALARALARARIDLIQNQVPRHARYGLLKACLNRSSRLGTASSGQGEILPVKPALTEDHPDAAYHCGRAMAVLAALQYAALGDVGAGVVQRYYAAASASPALVLGRLLRNAQFHLNKLDPGLRVWYEKKLAGILAQVETRFPANLDLEHQSLFALGYYQQQAHDRTRRTPVDNAPDADASDSLSAEE